MKTHKLVHEAVKLCPICRRGQLLDRIPRPTIVKTILFFLPLKRYKCYSCGRKPYLISKR